MPVVVSGVSHVYDGEEVKVKALDGIDLTVNGGETVLLVGRNGSGKSTLLHIMSGLMRPSYGTVTIDGKNAREARGAVSLAVQSPERALFCDTVYDDIAFGPRNKGVSGDGLSSIVMEASRLMGLEGANKNPRELSHGQKRLAALAGVVAMKPRYLFLDEPLAGLDAEGKAAVFKALGSLHEDGVAIVVASHRLDALLGLAGRVIGLEAGRIAFDCPPRQLICGMKTHEELSEKVFSMLTSGGRA